MMLARLRASCGEAFVCRDHWFHVAEPRRTRQLICDWLDGASDDAAETPQEG